MTASLRSMRIAVLAARNGPDKRDNKPYPKRDTECFMTLLLNIPMSVMSLIELWQRRPSVSWLGKLTWVASRLMSALCHRPTYYLSASRPIKRLQAHFLHRVVAFRFPKLDHIQDILESSVRMRRCA